MTFSKNESSMLLTLIGNREGSQHGEGAEESRDGQVGSGIHQAGRENSRTADQAVPPRRSAQHRQRSVIRWSAGGVQPLRWHADSRRLHLLAGLLQQVRL